MQKDQVTIIHPNHQRNSSKSQQKNEKIKKKIIKILQKQKQTP